MESGQPRVRVQRGTVVSRRIFKVASVDQSLRDQLLHASGVRSQHGQFVECSVGQLAVDALREEEEIDVIRIDPQKCVQKGGGFFKLALLIIDIRELDAHLRAQLRVVQFGKGILHISQAGNLAAPALTDGEQRQHFGECRRLLQGAAKVSALQLHNPPRRRPELQG